MGVTKGTPQQFQAALEDRLAELDPQYATTSIMSADDMSDSFEQRLIDDVCDTFKQNYDWYVEGTIDNNQITFTLYADESANIVLDTYVQSLEDIDMDNEDSMSDYVLSIVDDAKDRFEQSYNTNYFQSLALNVNNTLFKNYGMYSESYISDESVTFTVDVNGQPIDYIQPLDDIEPIMEDIDSDTEHLVDAIIQTVNK